jgi:hypothetical protein
LEALKLAVSVANNPKVYLIKTDPKGNIKWEKTFGGKEWDEAYSVQQTKDGGLILAGHTASKGAGGWDVYLIKTDSNGEKQWEKTYGGEDWDIAYSILQTEDRGFILAGGTASLGVSEWNVYLIKTDKEGNKEWEKTYGGKDWDVVFSVQQTRDGGFILAGSTESKGAGKRDVYLIKTDSKGNLEWQKTYGGKKNDEAYSVQQTRDGGFILAGYTESKGPGKMGVYLIKTDSRGILEWEKTYGGKEEDRAYSVQQTRDGSFILVGSTQSKGAGGWDVYLIKTDSNGEKQWEKTYGGEDWDIAYSVQQTQDGGYILGGFTAFKGAKNWDIYLIKTDAKGNKEWDKIYGGKATDVAYFTQQTKDGGFILAGSKEKISIFKVLGRAWQTVRRVAHEELSLPI